MVERYICTECGKDFELDAVKRYTETHGFTDGPFEEMTCCPYCGGGYELAEVCEECGTAFCSDDDTLFANKWCKDCLREMITFDNFIDFLKDDANDFGPYEVGYLEQFYFTEMWGFADDAVPKMSSMALKRDLLDLVKLNAKLNNLFKDSVHGSFLDKCKNFIMGDHDCAEAFAEWLADKEDCNG